MRRLGAELGVEAMSLYKHVANKEEILDGIVEVVVGEIEIPRRGRLERGDEAASDLGARRAQPPLMGDRPAGGARPTGPTALRYLDAILGNLRSAGFSIENAVHAFWLLDCYVYGHVIQETSMPISTSEEMTESTGSILEQGTADEYPHLVEVGEHALKSEYSVDSEFEFGLELILDALDQNAMPT